MCCISNIRHQEQLRLCGAIQIPILLVIIIIKRRLLANNVMIVFTVLINKLYVNLFPV